MNRTAALQASSWSVVSGATASNNIGMQPPTSIQIRSAVLADAPLLQEFNCALAQETESRALDAGVVHAGVMAFLTDPGKGRYFVAESGGAIAGQLALTYEWSDWRNGNFWWIQSVYVRADFRARGVFRALYQHVEQLARQTGGCCGLRLYVEHHNTRAHEVYRRLGLASAGYEVLEKDFTRGQ